jgi:hypothetical protein
LRQIVTSVYLEASRSFSHLLCLLNFPPWSQVPTGLSASLASTMHLVDALAKMQLTASSKSAECVSFSHNNVKMTLLKGPDALAARRAVASKLDHVDADSGGTGVEGSGIGVCGGFIAVLMTRCA